jgi:Ca2+-binding RTX toxin-like protein
VVGADLNIDLVSGVTSFRETGFDATGGWSSLVDVTWAGIENLIGGRGNDTLKGDAQVNRIDGGEGNDTIVAGNRDIVMGGKDRDELWADDSTTSTGFRLKLFSEGTQITAALAGATGAAAGVEVVRGNAGKDAIDASRLGLGAAIEAHGLAGNDTFTSGDSRDDFYGDADNDTIVYAGRTSNYVLTRTGAASFSIEDRTTHVVDTVHDVEVARFGDGTSIDLKGIADPRILGTEGPDVLVGDESANRLAAFGGDDVLIGKGSADELDGGTGRDTADYASSPAGVTVILESGHGAGGDAEGDTLISIENVTGAANFTNDLQGDANDNVIIGGELMDWLRGRGGSNTIDGRGGLDFMDYLDGFNQSVRVDLTVGKAFHSTGADTLISVEQFRLTNYDDTFIGSEQSDYVSGMIGKDHLVGNGGVDSFDGGLSDDWLEGGADGDYLIDSSDPLGGNDLLDGGNGDDYLAGGFGADTLTGGAGNDKFVFYNAADGGDFIQDFTSGDQIALSSYYFGLAGTGTLEQAGVKFVQGSAATGAGPSIVYDQANGSVYFDQDGTGAAAQQLLAHVALPIGTALHSSDFTVL